MENYTSYLYVAVRAALDAGKVIMDVYVQSQDSMAIEHKADHSPLTMADKRAHKTIMLALSATSLPILSEEGKEIPYKERSKWNLFWLVDPLDGTKEFIKRNGEFTVNIALIKNGTPVLGVIYVPVSKELFVATDGLGAYKIKNVDSTCQPSISDIMRSAFRLPVLTAHQGIVVVASRSHQSEETIQFIDGLRKQGMPVTMISSGSSLKICLVADGSADIYPRFAPTMEWDTAAGHAIARASGCEIYQIDEKTPLKYNKMDLHNPWFIVKPLR